MKTIVSFCLVLMCFFATLSASSTPLYTNDCTTEWPAVSEVVIARSANGLEISWMAATEERDIIYIIEKSGNGKQFTQVAVILGGFEENGRFAYKFREKQNNASAAMHYRIMQIKADGSARVVGMAAAQ